MHIYYKKTENTLLFTYIHVVQPITIVICVCTIFDLRTFEYDLRTFGYDFRPKSRLKNLLKIKSDEKSSGCILYYWGFPRYNFPLYNSELLLFCHSFNINSFDVFRLSDVSDMLPVKYTRYRGGETFDMYRLGLLLLK